MGFNDSFHQRQAYPGAPDVGLQTFEQTKCLIMEDMTNLPVLKNETIQYSISCAP